MQADSPIPADYPRRIKSIRERLDLTQAQLAERIGVSFATVNRWENGQTKPARLAWRQVIDLEARNAPSAQSPEAPVDAAAAPAVDFTARPAVVAAVAEATRLSYGHLANPAFATEVSLVHPLPHQRIAVYDRMLSLSPLRFLLADDAGAGKTIMTGLYLREVLARRLIKRVLVVPPAGLVGNWEREMRTLFALPFRIVRGADARAGNPFEEAESDRVIVSLDTLAGERMFGRLREAVASGAAPYDLVVFDEAHKLAADQRPDSTVPWRCRTGGRWKTDRYRLASALAGLPADEPRWQLGWSATHLLLLTATPHMGKDFPYYCLWRLLAPDTLATFDAFCAFPEAQRRRHFIRRTKEEMVSFDGRPLYPQRRCDTLSYGLTPPERALYAATTRYISETYNQARVLNRSAARLAMSVFQRRQASSTYALMRSFERRLVRLDEAIELVRAGRVDELERRQKRLGRPPTSSRRARRTRMPTSRLRGKATRRSRSARWAASSRRRWRSSGTSARRWKRCSRRLAGWSAARRTPSSRSSGKSCATGTSLWRSSSSSPNVGTRRTSWYAAWRASASPGRSRLIHGGLDYREREAQVELFRRPREDGGANCLVATDAAGEGINLQFCWLMVNYDVPWNPARLEQRMGRIHRYGQRHDPVVIVNLLAGETREGRLLKTLLEKPELIRQQLDSDKIFDVVGRLFENVSLKDYLEQASTEEGAWSAVKGIAGLLTAEQIRALGERERARFGGGDVKSRLPELRTAVDEEPYRRLLPGYVRRFLTAAVPLVGLRLDGSPDGVFRLAQERPGGLDPVLSEIEAYPGADGGFTLSRPANGSEVIWLRPGEPVFDRFCAVLLSWHEDEARRGAVFVDPHAGAPYLFHLARVSVVRQRPPLASRSLAVVDELRGQDANPEVVESRLVGLRQDGDGAIEPCPLEHLLLLRGASGVAPGSVPLARIAARLTDAAHEWLAGGALARLVDEHRARIEQSLPERLDWLARGCDHKAAELIAKRRRASQQARAGDAEAAAELARVKDEQRHRFAADKRRRLELLQREPSLVVAGDADMVAHALVLPTRNPADRQHHTALVEDIAMRLAQAREEAAGAAVRDVSRPELARRAGLGDWPGFDLLSEGPDGGRRAIEVKGRAGTGAIELSENE